MNKGPVCSNDKFYFFTKYLDFNNPPLFNSSYPNDGQNDFYDLRLRGVDPSVKNVFVHETIFDMAPYRLNKFKNLKNVFFMRLPDLSYGESGEFNGPIRPFTGIVNVYIKHCTSLVGVNKMFPNMQSLYIETLSVSGNVFKDATGVLKDEDGNIHENSQFTFKNLKSCTIFHASIATVFSQMRSAPQLKEFNLYFAYDSRVIEGPKWLENVSIVRIPPILKLPDSFSLPNLKNRILHYIYETAPSSEAILLQHMPNIEIEKFSSILFPVFNPSNLFLASDTCDVGVYLFDPKLGDMLKAYHYKRPLFIHGENVYNMSVVRRMKNKLVLFSNQNFFIDDTIELWKRVIFPHVQFIRLQSIVAIDTNAKRLAVSKSFKILLDLGGGGGGSGGEETNIKRINLETSSVNTVTLCQFLLTINERLGERYQKLITTVGFKYDENTQQTICREIGENVEFNHKEMPV